MDQGQYEALVGLIKGLYDAIQETNEHLESVDASLMDIMELQKRPGASAPVSSEKVKDRNLKPMPEEIESRLRTALASAQSGYTILAYCDGSVACQGSEDQASGSAAITFHKGRLTIQAAQQKGGTNNVGELSAIKIAMEGILRNFEVMQEEALPAHVNNITIVSDSQYALNVIKGTFRATANIALVDECQTLYKELSRKVGADGLHLEWVRGHAGNPLNVLADFYAGRAGLGFEIVGQYEYVPEDTSATDFLVACALKVKKGTAL
jgi:ribonuclease HI